MNLQILSVVWQEYKYDWSEHMARDERFHPAIMVSKSISFNYNFFFFRKDINTEIKCPVNDIPILIIIFRELFS